MARLSNRCLARKKANYVPRSQTRRAFGFMFKRKSNSWSFLVLSYYTNCIRRKEFLDYEKKTHLCCRPQPGGVSWRPVLCLEWMKRPKSVFCYCELIKINHWYFTVFLKKFLRIPYQYYREYRRRPGWNCNKFSESATTLFSSIISDFTDCTTLCWYYCANFEIFEKYYLLSASFGTLLNLMDISC